MTAIPTSAVLLRWYDRHRRDLPWRAKPGERPDPYRVWLSEIMLQQTTVAAVKPYFENFVGQWPDVRALARARERDVLRAWAGLGYYARARNLHACAKLVARELDGIFPADEGALRDLPGVGAYTAAAIAAIAFNRRAAAMDGNAERVIARLFGVETALPQARGELRGHALALVPAKRPGDFAQALMDLGAAVCTSRHPACEICPWREACAARAKGLETSLPRKAEKKARPRRYGAAFVALDGKGRVLLRRRPPKGLLGGMMEAPTSAWLDAKAKHMLRAAPFKAAWRKAGSVTHAFTHFALTLDVYVARVPGGGGLWVKCGRLGGEALPSVMRKVLDLGLGALSSFPRGSAGAIRQSA